MGGLGGDNGHLNHLYEDINLTFGRLKKLLNAVKDNQVELYEKVDGQNLSLTYNPRSHRPLAARNKSDIKSGGIDTYAVKDRYRLKPGVLSAFTSAMKVFDKSITELTYYQRFQTFDSGPGGIPFVNLEVMSTENPNVIKYSGNYLVMHGVSRYSEGTARGRSAPGTFKDIIGLIANSVVSTPEGTWMIKGPTKINLSRTANEKAMKDAIESVSAFMVKHHLEDDDTLRDYIEVQIILNHLNPIGAPSSIEVDYLNRMLDIPGTKSTPSIVKGLDWSLKKSLTELSRSRKKVVRDIIMPLELIVNDFGLGLLENSHSSFVNDGPDQVLDLQKRVVDALNTLSSVDDNLIKARVKMNLRKLREDPVENITSTVEGVVFTDPDNTSSNYKITGAFAPMNQILGLVNPSFAKSRGAPASKESIPIFVG
jgi:hypothetical protein